MLSSVTWLFLTCFAYLLALKLYEKAGTSPLLHPLITTSLLVGAMVYLSSTPVEDYQQHAQLLHFLLGPATVALAVPLYRQFHQVSENHRRILLPVLVGGTVAPVSAVLILLALDADLILVLSTWTKSITTPLAMESTLVLGGEPGLAAVIVIITGIIGAVFADKLFKVCRVNDDISKGVALGTVAHAVGTAQAFLKSEKAGAFSSLALCINGVVTAILLPVLFRMFA